LNRLLVESPDVLAAMPDDFVLVPLPYANPDLTAYALSLASENSPKPVVYALVGQDSVTLLLPQGPLQTRLFAA
jgi:hypothetical protein